jgi:hypothetical protein
MQVTRWAQPQSHSARVAWKDRWQRAPQGLSLSRSCMLLVELGEPALGLYVSQSRPQATLGGQRYAYLSIRASVMAYSTKIQQM